ncbi:TlpA disulfide reductase family protein [uncultured Croceitalea sp.]|uniref:TlpA family protein disulfide reductase n=1 Tax=uncultured Croceitalea sp. TaxID=1798908 RepID=UPI003305C14C
MKLKKGKLSDAVWVLVILLLLFTPLGFHARVQLMRLFSFSPKVEKQESYQKITNYNWELININGEKVNLTSKKDNVLVINYWATWCPPCVAEMPSLVALYNDYGNKVKFVFLASDDKAKVETYLEKNRYKFPVFFELEKSPKILQAASLPTTYIIDKSGNVILKEIGAANWNSKPIRALLDSLVIE